MWSPRKHVFLFMSLITFSETSYTMLGYFGRRCPLVSRVLSKNFCSEAILKNVKSSNTFGDLCESTTDFQKPLASESLPDDDDEFDVQRINRSKRPREWYRRKFVELVHRRPVRIREALQLFQEMKKLDRQVPQKTHWILVITACAHAGYTQKAFEFFEEMLKTSPITPTLAMYTSLFNSCAECPFPEFGLEKAKWLRQYCYENSVILNKRNYHSMIKAFAKLGDMETAFLIVKEMVDAKGRATSETFAMLLMGCISNKKSGLLDAIKIIRKMKEHRRQLDIYTFNLLLRAVRDCGVGSKENLEAFLSSWSSEKHITDDTQITSSMNNVKNLKDLPFKVQFESISDGSLQPVETSRNLPIIPNLLTSSSLSLTGQVVGINLQSLNEPHNRLMLVGGLDGFLDLMKWHQVKPDGKMFNMLAQCLPPDNESENRLIKVMKEENVKPDIVFFNMIIKRRCFRGDMKSAIRMVSKLQAYNLTPNIMTFGVLALACKSLDYGRQLIQDMDNAGFQINTEIISTLISNAAICRDFKYLLYLMDVVTEKDLPIQGSAIERMMYAKDFIQNLLAKHDRGLVELSPRLQAPEYREAFTSFKMKFKPWLKTTKLEKTEHPWKQYYVKETSSQEDSIRNYWVTMQDKFMKKLEKESEALE